LGKTWAKVHGEAPTRAAVSKAAGAEKVKLIIEGLKKYEAALKKLLEDAKKEGLEVKLKTELIGRFVLS